MKPQVIILGAGAAGLAAARVLSEARCPTVILEARDRIGGRIFTRFERDSRIPIELGAEFIHGRPRATWDHVHAAGLLTVDLPDDHALSRAGRVVSMSSMNDELDKVMKGLSRLKGEDISFAEYLKRHRGKATPQALRFAEHFVEGFDAADPQRISCKSLAEERAGIGDFDAEKQFRLVDGYAALVESFRAALDPKRVAIHLDTAVSEIHWASSKVECRATSPRGPSKFRARKLICTLPVGILQLPPEVKEAVRFEPDISAVREAAMMLGSGPVVKAVLRFRTAFWEDPRSAGIKKIDEGWRDAAFVHAPDCAFPTWWTQRPLRAALLTAWAGGPNAVRLAGLPEAALLEIAIKCLSKMTKLSPDTLAGLLESFHSYDWASDPWSRGAYSYVGVGGMNARKRLASPIEQTLYFAGEATDTSGQASTVAGAIASGERAAREMISEMK